MSNNHGSKYDLKNDERELNYLNNRNESPLEYDECLKIAQKIGAVAYIETSAKTGYGINDLRKLIVSTGTYHGKKKIENNNKCWIQ